MIKTKSITPKIPITKNKILGQTQIKVESSKVEPSKVESSKVEPSKVESSKVEPSIKTTEPTTETHCLSKCESYDPE